MKIKKKIIYLVSTKAITINLFFKDFINKQNKEFEIRVICSDPHRLELNSKIKKIKINFPKKISHFLNFRKLFKLFCDLSKIKKKLQNTSIILNTPVASHFFRLYFFFSKLNFIYFVHGFRFTPNGRWYKNLFFKKIEKILSFSTQKYITINSFDYNFVKNEIKKECIKINGVGIDILKKNNFREKKNKKLNILVISAYKKEKGFDDLFFIANFLNLRNFNIKFSCFGYGDYNNFRKIIKKNKIKNIILNKFNKNLKNEIKNYSLLFHPSLREGLPVSLMQCLSNGLPVIARNIRGCNDLVKNNYNGYLFNDNETAISQIIKLYNNKSLLIKMSQNAFNSITPKYSKAFIAKQITTFINE